MHISVLSATRSRKFKIFLKCPKGHFPSTPHKNLRVRSSQKRDDVGSGMMEFFRIAQFLLWSRLTIARRRLRIYYELTLHHHRRDKEEYLFIIIIPPLLPPLFHGDMGLPNAVK
ncbi:hypothetical protein CEXT_407611 [Caerostris extrusa]|uniref:Uncharacterized protein n=1 Tax=Caerostris extrusa TaxID=172846 RepID=A0AAV4TRF0_CAEEX|nr:hypothetical protein CEXT_407611 [Caerostris extrusa]